MPLYRLDQDRDIRQIVYEGNWHPVGFYSIPCIINAMPLALDVEAAYQTFLILSVSFAILYCLSRYFFNRVYGGLWGLSRYLVSATFFSVVILLMKHMESRVVIFMLTVPAFWLVAAYFKKTLSAQIA